MIENKAHYKRDMCNVVGLRVLGVSILLHFLCNTYTRCVVSSHLFASLPVIHLARQSNCFKLSLKTLIKLVTFNLHPALTEAMLNYQEIATPALDLGCVFLHMSIPQLNQYVLLWGVEWGGQSGIYDYEASRGGGDSLVIPFAHDKQLC